MKKYINLLFMAFLGAMMVFNACTPDEPELGNVISKGDLKYMITQNEDDPNMVILESLTPGVTPLWITPQGRSTRVKDTVKLPFPGEYIFAYGVQSAGGYIQGDEEVLSITTTNYDYISDPLWELLSGGVGNEKTWLLDINADGVSKYWNGPMYFSSDTWRWGGTCVEGSEDCWVWEAAYPGNEWIAGANDYGTMTFNLIGGPNVHVEHMNSGNRGVEDGVYMLDADAKTLALTDAAPLMNDWADGTNIDDWSMGYIISLTEEAMQIGYKDKGKSEFIIFNYISQEYSDNWVPEDLPDPEPPYDGDANSDLTTTTSTTKVWTIDVNYPYNWHGLDGAELNEVATYGNDPEGFAFTTWAPPYDAAVFGAISMALTKGEGADGTYVIETGAGTYEGAYTIDESNNIDFGQPITFFSGVGGWLTYGTTAENSLRVIKVETDAFGNVTALWLGQRAADKDEYFSVRFQPDSSGGGEGPSGTEIAFDNNKFVYGDLEENGNFRLELYNDYGATAADSPLNRDELVIQNRIEVTFTLSGITFADGAAGAYNTAFSLADGDWDPQYWGDGTQEEVVSVTGDGTYTVSYDPSALSEGAVVFVIDIKGMGADIVDLSVVSANIDNITVY